MLNQTAHPVQSPTENLINRAHATIAWATWSGTSTEYGLSFPSTLSRERFIAAVNRCERIAGAEWERFGDLGLVFTLLD